MIGAITAILVGLTSIVYLIRMVIVSNKRLEFEAGKRLRKKWLSACCFALFFLVVVPGVLETLRLVPNGSLGCAGAILCFLIAVPSGNWNFHRLSCLPRQNHLDGEPE